MRKRMTIHPDIEKEIAQSWKLIVEDTIKEYELFDNDNHLLSSNRAVACEANDVQQMMMAISPDMLRLIVDMVQIADRIDMDKFMNLNERARKLINELHWELEYLDFTTKGKNDE